MKSSPWAFRFAARFVSDQANSMQQLYIRGVGASTRMGRSAAARRVASPPAAPPCPDAQQAIQSNAIRSWCPARSRVLASWASRRARHAATVDDCAGFCSAAACPPQAVARMVTSPVAI